MSGDKGLQHIKDWHVLVALALLGLAGPLVLPSLITQIAFLWLMVTFAVTWDMLGGRMGYNSFGNIVFFGIGCYAAAVIQRDAGLPYFEGLALGIAAGAVVAVVWVPSSVGCSLIKSMNFRDSSVLMTHQGSSPRRR